MNGCSEYWDLLDRADNEPDDHKAWVIYSLAHNHKTQCPICKRINTPLEEQFFIGKKVTIVNEP